MIKNNQQKLNRLHVILDAVVLIVSYRMGIADFGKSVIQSSDESAASAVLFCHVGVDCTSVSGFVHVF